MVAMQQPLWNFPAALVPPWMGPPGLKAACMERVSVALAAEGWAISAAVQGPI